MTEILPWGALGAVSNEEDLTRPCVRINPPPPDGRCKVCGRHLSELKPFGGPSTFSGKLLVKRWRPMGPYDEDSEKAWEQYEKENPLVVKFEQPIRPGVSHVEYEDRQDPIQWFIDKFGEDEGKRLYWNGQASGCIGASWECRDCFILDDDEYFEKLGQRYPEHGDE